MGDLSVEHLQTDWRINLMIGIKEWISANPSLFLPIVQSWPKDSSEELRVPPLRKYLKVENKEELPGLILYHPASNTAMRYPEPLDDMYKVSPELVITWAKIEVLKMEISLLERRLREYDDPEVPTEQKLTEEQKPRAELHVAEMKPVLQDIETEHASIKDQLKTKNAFADKAKKHLDSHTAEKAKREEVKKEED